jgi:Fe2+ or Zn2+ uptake regulation protein
MRKTPQTNAVMAALAELRHASNNQLFDVVRVSLPEITPNSVHRITARLAEDGIIGVAPSADGVTVLDITPTPHHHFVCLSCHRVTDIEVTDAMIESIAKQLPSGSVCGGLTVFGACKQ